MYRLSKAEDAAGFTCTFRRSRFEVAYKSAVHARHVQYNVNAARPNPRLRVIDPTHNVHLGRAAEAQLLCRTQQLQESDREGGSESEDESARERARAAFEVVGADDVYLNPRVRLFMSKRPERQRTYQRRLADELMYHVHLSTVQEKDVLLLPFVKDTGVVVAHAIAEEDERTIELEGVALFPESYLDRSVDPVPSRRRRLERLLP